MIFVDRANEPEPQILNKVLSNNETETDRAIAHYSPPWDRTTFNFKRYKEDEVKQALERLFRDKCAYCESDFRHVSPEDIEHWRPKGAVTLENGTEQKPGYYWLAATWDNLLPSCIDCNRRRRQDDARDPNNAQSGKANLFPVEDEAHRWTRHDQANQNDEVPLLLDPCVDRPEQFLEVSDQAVVTEAQPAGTMANRRAKASIDVFGLNRSHLRDRRKAQRDLVLALFRDVRLYISQLPHLQPGSVRDDTMDALKQKLLDLKAHQSPESEYLLMKKPMITEFIQVVGPDLQNLGIVP